MISFHIGYLWGKPGKTAFRLIASCLAVALLWLAGVFESPGILDWTRYRMPTEYIEEGWRIVRFTSGLFASLHGALVHLRTSLQYRAFVCGDGIGKWRFFVPRLVSEGLLLTVVYTCFCAMYVLIGSLVSLRFQISQEMIERMIYGALFVFQCASYSALLGFLTNSIMGALPIIALCVFFLEIRVLEQLNDDRALRILARLLLTEQMLANGKIIVYEPVVGGMVLVISWLLISIAYWLRDGEGP